VKPRNFRRLILLYVALIVAEIAVGLPVVWGAVLALSYYSPVATHFERPKQWSKSTVES
jgi:hypothetical protein